jgi:hypothetical protein
MAALGSVGDVFNAGGAAVNDLFAADAAGLKAQGLGLEATNYDAAAALAGQNEKFTEQSTAIKELQAQRNIYQTLGTEQADTGGAGLASSGSALDLLRSSASQGALTKAVLGQQGLITEAGYREQQQAYTNMASASRLAQEAEKDTAQADTWGAVIQGTRAVLTAGSMMPIPG